jgi:outer membrane protein insertion porin family
VFVDAGQIYINGQEPPERQQDALQSFRYSAGVGVAWNSPVGPLKFSYAYPLNQKPLDKIQRFQFQVGTVF